MQSISGQARFRVLLASVLVALFHAPLGATPLWDQLFDEQRTSAEQGDPDAQYEVALMYLKGRGVGKDFDAALGWLEKASANGSEQASAKLKRLLGQKQKFTASLKRAESGDTAAQYDTGMMYLKGRGVKRDAARGRKWLERAAEKSHEKAVTRLAILLFKGEGGEPDYARARQLLMDVSETSALAQYYLGELYASGKGVPRDFTRAMDWYRKAAASGFSMAGGKVINMEEELRMQARRKANAGKARAARELRVAAAQAPMPAPEPARSSGQPQPPRAAAERRAADVRRETKAPAKARKPAARPKPVKTVKALSPLERLAAIHWATNHKPMEYLPSEVTRCELDAGVLVCFSDELKRESGNHTVLYKVKSEIRRGKDGFTIAYRNLVLGVENMELPDDGEDALGYDDEVEQGFSIQTGWTKAHQVRCLPDGVKAMDCVKDKTHRVHLVADRR